MDFLPDEMLDMVFQYVSTPELVAVCARVCRRWKQVSERRTLLLRVKDDEPRLHRGIRAVLLTTFPVNLMSLLEDITTKTRFLREFTAHAPASFHDDHLPSLQLLPYLIHLDIFTMPRLLDERLIQVCKRLHTLVVNETIGPGFLRQLATSPHLVALHMFGRAVHYPRRELVTVLRERGPHLRELTLRCNELPDSAYDAIGDCYNLRVLHLYSCWLLTGIGARALCRPQYLRQLHLTGARLVRRRYLADVLAELPDGIQDLVLSNGWFCDDHVRIVIRRLPELRSIELWDCRLTAAGAVSLATGLQKLERLDLDITLSERRLQRLARHPSLRFMRCIPPNAGHKPEQYMEDHPQWEVDGLKIVATFAPYPRKYFRAGGDGYRSSLFYYWTRDVRLQPMPPHTGHGFQPYDELFY